MELLALGFKGFFLGFVESRRVVNLYRHNGIDYRLVISIVDFQDDVGARCFNRVEENGS